MLSSWIQFVSASQFREFMQFMWFVLEKRTPYEACVEPYQHVAPRGATSSRASTRVFIFSVSPAPLLRPAQKPARATPRATHRAHAGHLAGTLVLPVTRAPGCQHPPPASAPAARADTTRQEQRAKSNAPRATRQEQRAKSKSRGPKATSSSTRPGLSRSSPSTAGHRQQAIDSRPSTAGSVGIRQTRRRLGAASVPPRCRLGVGARFWARRWLWLCQRCAITHTHA